LKKWVRRRTRLRQHYRRSVDKLAGKYNDKKENKTFIIYKEILKGAVAKSYMTNGLLIYDLIFAHFLIY
jgi:hypothetical protein